MSKVSLAKIKIKIPYVEAYIKYLESLKSNGYENMVFKNSAYRKMIVEKKFKYVHFIGISFSPLPLTDKLYLACE